MLMRKTIWLIALAFAPGLVLAASGQADEAVKSIIDIFGLDPRSLDTLLHGTNAPGIIASISSVINAAALYAAVAMMIWTTITMTANTAHEGNLGGEKYSNLWIPLRSAFSLALVLPVAKGYSLVQIMILLFAMIGFKFADLTWDAVLDHFQNTGPIVNVSPPDTDQLVTALYKSHLCMLKLSTFSFKGKKEARVKVKTKSLVEKSKGKDKDGAKTYIYSFDGIPGTGINATEAICGSFTIKHPPGPVSAYMHEATIKTFNELSGYLNREARLYLASKKKFSREVQEKTADAIQKVIYAYNQDIRAAAARAIHQGKGEVNTYNQAFYRVAKENGWIMAGAWFWTMAGINRQISDTIQAKPTYTTPKYNKMGKFWRLELENVMIRTNSTVMPKVDPENSTDIAGLAGQEDVHNWIKRWTNDAFGAITQSVSATVLEGGHAESKLQSLGHHIVIGAEAIYVAMAIAKATARGLNEAKKGSVLNFIPGLGETTRGLSGFAISIIEDVSKIVSMLVLALLLLGLLLSFYFPAIPFINWFVAVIGWLVMLLEAVFAAPFWAAAHAVPEGEGIAGSHGKAGWMLVLSLIARPVLMIAGLVGGMLLLHYGSELLLGMFALFTKSMNAGSWNGIATLMGMLVLLVVMVLITAPSPGLVRARLTWARRKWARKARP